MKSYEYKIRNIFHDWDHGKMVVELNEESVDGWKLASMYLSRWNSLTAVFVREKHE